LPTVGGGPPPEPRRDRHSGSPRRSGTPPLRPAR
jgi:hypothetical protein